MTTFHVLLDSSVNHISDVRVDVGGSIGDIQVHLSCSYSISTECGIMLKTVASSVLMYR